MKYTYIFIFSFVTQIVTGQSILEFQNLTPIWIHSSEVLENNDGLYESLKPVIINDNLYLTTATASKFFNGFLLEKMDFANGTVKWRTKYFPTGFVDREYPQRPFLLDNRLVLPSFRQTEGTGLETLWSDARLTYRFFDDSNGELLKTFMDDSLGVRMRIPPKALFETKNELVQNKNRIQYITGNSSPSSYLLDYDANLISDTSLVIQSPVFNDKIGNYIVFQDKIIRYVFLTDFFTNERIDRIDIFNLDFELEKTIDISKYIIYYPDTKLTYADDDVFIIETQLKSSVDQKKVIKNRKYYMFDYERNLLDKAKLDWYDNQKGNDYYYNITIGRNVKGNKILALITNDDENGFHDLAIKESDGNEEMKSLAVFKAKNKIDKFNVFHFDYNENGDMLISLEYIIEHNPENISQSDFRVNTMLISKDDF